MKVSTSSIRKLIEMGVNPDRKDFPILAAQLDIAEMKKRRGLPLCPTASPAEDDPLSGGSPPHTPTP